MDAEEFNSIQKANLGQLFWVRFVADAKSEYLVCCDYLLFNFVHQTKMEMYYEVCVQVQPHQILEMRPSGISEKEAVLIGFENQKHLEETLADPKYWPKHKRKDV